MVSRTSWFVVDLGDASLSQPQLCELQTGLSQIYETAGKPPGMLAVFRHESQALHCHTKLFLTEEFQQAAHVAQAVKCPAPQAGSVSYLSGNEACYWPDHG